MQSETEMISPEYVRHPMSYISSNKLTPVVHALNDDDWLSGVSTLWEAKLTR